VGDAPGAGRAGASPGWAEPSQGKRRPQLQPAPGRAGPRDLLLLSRRDAASPRWPQRPVLSVLALSPPADGRGPGHAGLTAELACPWLARDKTRGQRAGGQGAWGRSGPRLAVAALLLGCAAGRDWWGAPAGCSSFSGEQKSCFGQTVLFYKIQVISHGELICTRGKKL